MTANDIESGAQRWLNLRWFANNKDTVQSALPHSLISAFRVIRFLETFIPKLATSKFQNSS